MADIKEKLVELLGNNAQCKSLGIDGCDGCQYAFDENCHSKAIAGHLVSNGVTILQWISVEERMPENIGDYIVVVKSKYDWEPDYTVDVDVAGYDPYAGWYIDGCWNTFNDWNEGQQYLHVTHWMPLPEPPKGE